MHQSEFEGNQINSISKKVHFFKLQKAPSESDCSELLALLCEVLLPPGLTPGGALLRSCGLVPSAGPLTGPKHHPRAPAVPTALAL